MARRMAVKKNTPITRNVPKLPCRNFISIAIVIQIDIMHARKDCNRVHIGPFPAFQYCVLIIFL